MVFSADVEALSLQQAAVGIADIDVGDLARSGVARDRSAEHAIGVRKRDVAIAEHAADAAAQRQDRPGDVDAIPVEAQGKVRNPARCQHRAEGDRVRNLGAQVRIASGGVRDVGVGLNATGEHVSLIDTLRDTHGAHRSGLLRGWRLAAARIGDH